MEVEKTVEVEPEVAEVEAVVAEVEIKKEAVKEAKTKEEVVKAEAEVVKAEEKEAEVTEKAASKAKATVKEAEGEANKKSKEVDKAIAEEKKAKSKDEKAKAKKKTLEARVKLKKARIAAKEAKAKQKRLDKYVEEKMKVAEKRIEKAQKDKAKKVSPDDEAAKKEMEHLDAVAKRRGYESHAERLRIEAEQKNTVVIEKEKPEIKRIAKVEKATYNRNSHPIGRPDKSIPESSYSVVETVNKTSFLNKAVQSSIDKGESKETAVSEALAMARYLSKSMLGDELENGNITEAQYNTLIKYSRDYTSAKRSELYKKYGISAN